MLNDNNLHMDYFHTTVLNPDWLSVIVEVLRTTHWAEKISFEQVALGFKNSTNIFILQKSNNNLIGFGRLITDKATFAYLTDVYVSPDHRGKGIANFISSFLINNSEVSIVNHFALIASHENVNKMYKSLGFIESEHQKQWLELFKK